LGVFGLKGGYSHSVSLTRSSILMLALYEGKGEI